MGALRWCSLYSVPVSLNCLHASHSQLVQKALQSTVVVAPIYVVGPENGCALLLLRVVCVAGAGTHFCLRTRRLFSCTA